jgi:hypothetical protein
MRKREKKSVVTKSILPVPDYGQLVAAISNLLEHARRTSARTINSIITATYWEIGRRIVEYEQVGKARAEYGKALLKNLSHDLSSKYGRGFSERNLEQMRNFYLGWEISQTPSAKLEAKVRPAESYPKEPQKRQTLSAESGQALVPASAPIKQGPVPLDLFPLSWSQYVRLLSVANVNARAFYESEAIRGGWSVRQLDRQIGTQFYERTTHSKRQDLMLARGQQAKPEDLVSIEDEIRDPYLL